MLQYVLCLVAQSCPTLCDPMDCSPLGSSVHGILQAMSSSRGSSQPRGWTPVSHIAGRFFTIWATREAQEYLEWVASPFSRRSSWHRNRTGVSCIAGWRRQWHPTPVLSPGRSHGRRSLVGFSPWGLEESEQDWATSLLLFTFMHWRRKWQPTPVFLRGESQGRKSLVGCHLWGCTESDTTEVT